MPSLKAALKTVHRDRAWWQKVLIGGAAWLTLIGYPLVEGYGIESLDNTKNGYPTPLPRWADLGTKFVQGMFALVIDFAYFVFPLLGGGMLLLCSALALSLAGTGGAVVQIVSGVGGVLVAGWLVIAWLLSVSPVGKRLYVGEGDVGQALSGKVVREVLEPIARPIYFKTRLLSLVIYLIPLALLVVAWLLANRSGWLALGLLWLALSALLYARLVSVQLYDAAAREVQQQRFEAFRARTRGPA